MEKVDGYNYRVKCANDVESYLTVDGQSVFKLELNPRQRKFALLLAEDEEEG